MSATVIKDVTRALQALLLSQLNPSGGSTAQVSLVPPGESLPAGLGVNLYLYRVMESHATKNQPWAGDRVTPPGVTPALGLELSYLLTPFATVPDATSAAGDDAHAVLGTAMLAFHENPVINDIHIPGFDADSVLSADLQNSFEQVKIRLANTSLDELSKIWATINQPYRLSVAYEVSLVMVVPPAPQAESGAPVARTGLTIAAWSAPPLESLVPASGPLAKVAADGTLSANPLTITGSGMALAGATPVVKFGGEEVSTTASTDTTATILMPSTVDAGPAVDVTVGLAGKTGAPLTFEITPWLQTLMPLRSTLEAPLLTLRGQGFPAAPASVRLDGPGGTVNVTSFSGTPTDSQAAVTLPANLANGSYRVRAVLSDGSVSNPRTLEVIPVLATVAAVMVSAGGKQVHRLTLSGARLNGADVRVIVDGSQFAVGPNAGAAQLVATLGRQLASGAHAVSVAVDGSESHTVTVQVA